MDESIKPRKKRKMIDVDIFEQIRALYKIKSKNELMEEFGLSKNAIVECIRKIKANKNASFNELYKKPGKPKRFKEVEDSSTNDLESFHGTEDEMKPSIGSSDSFSYSEMEIKMEKPKMNTFQQENLIEPNETVPFCSCANAVQKECPWETFSKYLCSELISIAKYDEDIAQKAKNKLMRVILAVNDNISEQKLRMKKM